MNELLKNIGFKIKGSRKEKKLSQEDLAWRVNMDRSYLSELENGHKNPSIIMLRNIAEAMGLDIKDLL